MAYEVYIDDMLLPIPPQKIQIKNSSQNKTVNLINGDEVNIIKGYGLADISLAAVFPQVCYPFAMYDGGFEDAGYFLDKLEELKEGGGAFPFIVVRNGPGGREFHDTNLDVTLESFTVSDDAKEGCDVTVSISLKEYHHYGAKRLNIVIVPETQVPQASTQEDRQTDTAPQSGGTYTVESGDNLWKIAKKRLGDGGRWKEIHELNRDKVSNPNRIYPGQVLTLP